MLNEFLIFTAIILLPINAILIDHVSVRREILARLEKPVKLSQYSERMISAFGSAALSAIRLNSAFSGMFLKSDEKVDILIHRGNNDRRSGCFIVPTPGRGRSFIEDMFLREENRIFGVTEEPVLWDSCSADILGDINSACLELKNAPSLSISELKNERRRASFANFKQAFELNILRQATDEARQELIDFKHKAFPERYIHKQVMCRFFDVSPPSLSDTISAVERLTESERDALTFERKERP